jgi:hypothetical protein
VHKAIGEQLQFTNQSGEQLVGEIVGRDWCFERLVSYTVRVAKGLRYIVNADTLRAGHSF